MATASEIVTALETALAARASSGTMGVVSVNIDGTTTTYASFDVLLKELQYWQKQAAKQAGKRRLVNTLDLRNV
jgi:uncharacterized protein YccT (UPF0319 family)